MTATTAQVARLRLMVNEPTVTTYGDVELKTRIEAYPLMDELGTEPYYWDYSTTPPSQVANTDWLATYDLNAAAADIWDEKAGVLSEDYDFSADGGNYTRSQAYEQAAKQARKYHAHKSAKAIRLRPFPRPLPTLIDQDLP
jgi:hypothetical protein